MPYEDFLNFLQNIGKDPSRLIFEDELTGIFNRRFLLNYFQYKIPWDSLQDRPVSLIMMDVDRFKEINDRHGHPAGDQVLVWVAGLIKEVSGDEHLPVRYAGDEFMILMDNQDKAAALKVGESLLGKIHQNPLRLSEEDPKEALQITLSLGIATAPEDAQNGKGLIQKADTALYCAKKGGRDRLAHAGEIDPHEVIAKTAIQRLEGEKIAGRRPQLAQATELLKRFGQGQSVFLLLQGGAGQGKTTFLETIRLNLAHSEEIALAKVKGAEEESSRPYSLITRILIDLLQQRPDKGIGALESLSPQEVTSLSCVLPQLRAVEELSVEQSGRTEREGIFITLTQFLSRITGARPLVILVDDLQFADEASLFVLRQAMARRGSPLFLGGTAPEKAKEESRKLALEKFRETYGQEMDLRVICLPPLTTADIAEHLEQVFPRVSTPPNFARDLERITRGNPLFLSEILRQMVLDQKITLQGARWVISPVGESYFPPSLEAMVQKKLARFDNESRNLLHQASFLGEDVPISLLAGSSREKEAKILEVIDEAVAQGLLTADFKINDETVRFPSKPILEIAQKGLTHEQKKALHERIGTYQEALYRQHLLPSPAPLAYHFRQAGNPEKAGVYEKLQSGYSRMVFNAVEIPQYAGDRRAEQPPPGSPLDSRSLALVPTVLRSLLTILRNIKLYPPGSEAILSANRQLKEAIDPILSRNESLTIFQVRQVLMINGQRLDVGEFRLVAEDLLKNLNRAEMQGIVFQRGLTEPELEAFLTGLGRIKPKMIDRDYWRRFSVEKRLVHIEIKQVRYTLMVDPERREGTAAPPGKIPSMLVTRQQKLDPEDLVPIHEILRAFLNAAKNIKLYPVHSRTILHAIEQLRESLQKILSKRPALTLAQVSDTLIINGSRIEPSGIEALVDSFLKFFDSLMLSSLTFLDTVSLRELQTFVGTLTQFPITRHDRDFWRQFAREHKITGILFDQVLYEPRVTGQIDSPGDEPEAWELVEGIEPVAEEAFDGFLKAMPGRLRDLLTTGDEKQARVQVLRLFLRFQDRPLLQRENTIEICRRLLEELTLAFQNRLAKLFLAPLLDAMKEEKDPKALREMAALLHRMATLLIQFADYPQASRALLYLHGRQRQLEGNKDPHAQRLAKILERKLEPATQKILVNDLKSADCEKQRGVALLIASLGRVAIPVLIEAIKKGDDFRVRQIAANLLREMGTEAAEALKKELILEGAVEERKRVLEIVDTVTRDLKTELAYALGDENPAVRQSALRLLERLNDKHGMELLMNYAAGPDTNIAVEAIDSLGKIKAPGAVKILIPLLKRKKDPQRTLASCRALGQIADPAAIEPLAGILVGPSFFGLRKKRQSLVRAAAALALSRIDLPRAAELLKSFVSDPDPRVREIARSKSLDANPGGLPPEVAETTRGGTP